MQFTVIGYIESTGQIFSDHVEAVNGPAAMATSAEEVERDDAVYVCAIRGHLNEGDIIDFAGDSVVDAETIREQQAVFS